MSKQVPFLLKIQLGSALFVLFSASAMGQQNDWLIVPGRRLGPLNANTTRADLDRIFGKSDVQDQSLDGGEGPEPATVVFPKTPDAALAIFWQDNRMDRVMICYQHEAGPCKWHTQNRVSLGTNLQQLETLNGRAFQIENWGYDLGGNISSWRRGKLEAIFGSRLVLSVYFQKTPQDFTSRQRTLLNEIDRHKRKPLSTDAAVRELDPTVTRMELIFTGKD